MLCLLDIMVYKLRAQENKNALSRGLPPVHPIPNLETKEIKVQLHWAVHTHSAKMVFMLANVMRKAVRDNFYHIHPLMNFNPRRGNLRPKYMENYWEKFVIYSTMRKGWLITIILFNYYFWYLNWNLYLNRDLMFMRIVFPL